MNSLKELRQLALNDSRLRHPTLPESARSTRNYSDKSANGLTRCIIDFLRFNGYQAERINCTGRAIDQTRVVTDILGDMKRIGSVKWLPTSGQKGTADISATIRGQSVKIEVKMKDRQSPDQKVYQAEVERAGGIYAICHNFQEFIDLYNKIL
jgi:hypothetical protein